jgi:hypothetical protein
MIDKHRHIRHGAPHGSAPNWVLAVLCVCAVVLVIFAGPLL